MLGLDLLKEIELEVNKNIQNLRVAQYRQKRYVDLKIQHKEFEIGYHVYLSIKTKKSSIRLGNYANLSPRYCRPSQILEIVGLEAYKLTLPVDVKVHNVFHIYLLKMYVDDPRHIIDWNVV